MDANTDAAAHLKTAAQLAWDARWTMSFDMNNDDAVNVADMWLLTSWFFFAPGDAVLLLTMMYVTPVALFLGLDPLSLSGLFSGIFSGVFWILFLGFFARR